MSGYEPPYKNREGEVKYDAYYYGFEPTGVYEVDIILSAVAHAGKLAHHTESWMECFCWPVDPDHRGLDRMCPNSSVGVIEAAAGEAARLIRERANDAT